MLFKCTAKTAVVTQKDDMLCLCNFAYVPKNIATLYSDTYHLNNGLVERLLNELVQPFRKIRLTDAEIICLSAIIVFNPMAKDLSEYASKTIAQIRERICGTLYSLMKEEKTNCCSSIVAFGNLLLYLPIVTALANAMYENIRFAQTFSLFGGTPLLTNLFGCFPVESFVESEMALHSTHTSNTQEQIQNDTNMQNFASVENLLSPSCCSVHTQTEEWIFNVERPKKLTRRMSTIFEESGREFCLLKAPGSFTLAEMFDDRINGNLI